MTSKISKFTPHTHASGVINIYHIINNLWSLDNFLLISKLQYTNTRKMSLTALEEYIETGNSQDLELLLVKNPELTKAKTSLDVSPLLLACYYHKQQVIQTILKHTTTITIHEACALGLAEHVENMLNFKPEVIEEFSTHGFSALAIATHFNKEEVVRVLLKHRADPNLSSQNGYNTYPLHAALSNNNSIIGKMLIEAGADVNVVQNGRITPLHLAAQYGNIEIIVLLLEQGADVSVVTELGSSASDLAAEKGYREIAEILK